MENPSSGLCADVDNVPKTQQHSLFLPPETVLVETSQPSLAKPLPWAIHNKHTKLLGHIAGTSIRANTAHRVQTFLCTHLLFPQCFPFLRPQIPGPSHAGCGTLVWVGTLVLRLLVCLPTGPQVLGSRLSPPSVWGPGSGKPTLSPPGSPSPHAPVK